MAGGGRYVLALHFAKLIKEAPHMVKDDDSIDSVHDMRVATRRLRSMFALFKPYFPKESVRPLNRTLREIASALGVVRDLDVFRLMLQAYAQTRPPAETAALRAMLTYFDEQRSAALVPLHQTLDSAYFEAFQDRFKAFLEEVPPPKTTYLLSPKPSRICDVVPILIYEQSAAVRAYEEHLERLTLDGLHALRIEVKRLRYSLEAFAPVLGEEASIVIKATKVFQDSVGELQDTRVAVDYANGYLESAFSEETIFSAEASVVRTFLTFCYEEMSRLRQAVPSVWAEFNAPSVRRAMALAVGAL